MCFEALYRHCGKEVWEGCEGNWLCCHVRHHDERKGQLNWKHESERNMLSEQCPGNQGLVSWGGSFLTVNGKESVEMGKEILEKCIQVIHRWQQNNCPSNSWWHTASACWITGIRKYCISQIKETAWELSRCYSSLENWEDAKILLIDD